MATAHSTVACRCSTFRPALLSGTRTGHTSFSVLCSSRCLPLYVFVLFAYNFMQHSQGNSAPQQTVQTCNPGTSPLSLRLASATNKEVKFKCGEGLELLKNPNKDGKLCGNAACTKEIDASAFTFEPSSQATKQNSTPDTEYSLGLKDSLPTTPLTVYFSCDPKSVAGGGGPVGVEASDSNKSCLVQVSVFSQQPTPVPDKNKCTDEQVTLAITSNTKSVTFGCNKGATLKPALFERVFIAEAIQKGDGTSAVKEKEVVLQDLVPNSSLVENAATESATVNASTESDTVGYTLSCPDLPSSAQNFFYKCVSPSPASNNARDGAQKECKVLISVEKKPEPQATATPAPSRGEKRVALTSSFMIVSILLVKMATETLF